MRGEYRFQFQGWHDHCRPDPWETQIFLNIETAVDGSPSALPSEASTLRHLFFYVGLIKNSITPHYKELKQNLQDGLLTDLFESLASINSDQPDLSTPNINFFPLGPSDNFFLRNSPVSGDYSQDDGDDGKDEQGNEEGDGSEDEEGDSCED
jgi:hypothetical protein